MKREDIFVKANSPIYILVHSGREKHGKYEVIYWD